MAIQEGGGIGLDRNLRSIRTSRKRRTRQARSDISQVSSRNASSVLSALIPQIISSDSIPRPSFPVHNAMSTRRSGNRPTTKRNPNHPVVRYQDIATRKNSKARLHDLGVALPSPFTPKLQDPKSEDSFNKSSTASLKYSSLKPENSQRPFTGPFGYHNDAAFSLLNVKIPDFTSAGHIMHSSTSPMPSTPQMTSRMTSQMTPTSMMAPTGQYKTPPPPLLDHFSSSMPAPASPSPFLCHPDLEELETMPPMTPHSLVTYPNPNYIGRHINNQVNPPMRNDRTVSGPWQEWDIYDVYLADLPPNIRTADIWRTFSEHGNIDSIEIFVNKAGMKDSNGKVSFRPPPRRDFNSGNRNFTLKTKDGKRHHIHASLKRNQKMYLNIPSPVRANILYPERTELEAQRLEFGVMVGPSTMLIKRTKASVDDRKVRLVLNLYHKEITVFFAYLSDRVLTEYKFLVSIDQPLDIWLTGSDDGEEAYLTLTLKTPPHYLRKVTDATETHQDDNTSWRQQDAWIRQTSVLLSKEDAGELKDNPITLKNSPEGMVSIGRWTTYRITLSREMSRGEDFYTFRAALLDHNIVIKERNSLSTTNVGKAAWDLLDESIDEYLPRKDSSTASSGNSKNDLQDVFHPLKNHIYLAPDVHYQLLVCVSQRLIDENSITRHFLMALSNEDSHRARHRLEMISADRARIFDPMDIFDLPMRSLSIFKNRVPENYAMLRSAIVTPSSLILNTPGIEQTNRVLRKYRQHSDRFLRVRFEDDEFRGFKGISATRLTTMDAVLSRFYRTVTSGIIIGDKHFEFLAFGNSQLRDKGAYFFASLPNLTASHIRAWMGRFDKEQIVAKHAARIGQCFSTTRAIRTVSFPTVRKEDLIEDVVRGLYTFTDGVGKISRFYAETIARELCIRKETPSVFQFRMGGCKGVLAIDPELKAMTVKLRESQFKFETTYSEMEINRWSEFWAASLNRQLILILSALGVPDETFLGFQDALIQQMADAMDDDNAAVEALTKTVDPNRMTLTIAGLVQAGFRACKEPFVTSLIHLWRAWSTKYLKEKAKIPISEGAFVLGCTDETQTLKGYFYNQRILRTDKLKTKISKLPEIFIQIIHPASGKKKVITGICIVARNPSLHAGDIRVVNAVDVPALHHLVDVLVLPQTGDRDVSSMCSGGDLDGDDYVVIWDQRLIPPIWNEEPMDYTPPQPKRLDRPVTQHDITKFFVKYMKNDFLPTIATSHLAWADDLDGGVRNPKCLELAVLHSKAVDYPKTGQPAEMGKHLNAKRKPHFMEKKGRTNYHSEKVLGRLYDSVMRVVFQPDHDDVFDDRILNACEPDVGIIEAATELKKAYDISLQQIMAQHDIKTEFEVWSTFVLDHSKASSDFKFHEEIGQLSSGLKSHYFGLVAERAGGKSWAALVPWAVAMYRITRDQFEAAKLTEENVMPMISFPWILRSTLVQIVKTVEQAKMKSKVAKDVDLTMTLLEPNTEIFDDPYVPPEAGPEDSTEPESKADSKIGCPKADTGRVTPDSPTSPAPLIPRDQHALKANHAATCSPPYSATSAGPVKRRTPGSDLEASASSMPKFLVDGGLTSQHPLPPDPSHSVPGSPVVSHNGPIADLLSGQQHGQGDVFLDTAALPGPVQSQTSSSFRDRANSMPRNPSPHAHGIANTNENAEDDEEEEEEEEEEEYEDPLATGGMIGEVWE